MLPPTPMRREPGRVTKGRRSIGPGACSLHRAARLGQLEYSEDCAAPALSLKHARPGRKAERRRGGQAPAGPGREVRLLLLLLLQSFSSTSDLSRHMDLHEGVLQHACHTCGHYAATRLDLSRHEGTREHLTRRQNACCACGRGFDSRSLLDGHAFDCCAGSDVQDLSKPNVQYDERTSRPVCAEANNNDRKFKSRNGMLSPPDAQPATAYLVASESLPSDLGRLSATFFPRSASVGAPFSAIRSLDSLP
ncbi:hypothetical protein HPB47_019782 [Ixodes persulcatus]|uniref:Uncharacterized protein n=1 Tax=Ixodes persulcatus TaxID=34615 RepID=A0AC60QKT0_IXOPE|nr:hypothetical protein HPB47_019782 [Ixodes persulcatus]